MKNYKTLLLTLLFSVVLFPACGTSDKNHSNVIGSAISVTTDDKQATIAPSTQALDEVSQIIANILKIQLDEINQQESATVTATIHYCDISGLKKWENSTLFSIKYEACQNEKYLQEGELKLSYEKTEEVWHYPPNLKLQVKNNYTLNDTTLQKNLLIESSINYTSDMDIKSISFIVSGLIDFNYQTIKLDNYPSTITF